MRVGGRHQSSVSMLHVKRPCSEIYGPVSRSLLGLLRVVRGLDSFRSAPAWLTVRGGGGDPRAP